MTHATDTSDIGDKQQEATKVTLHNRPETIEAATQRIMDLEMALDDLVRSVEIATMSRQYEILGGFLSAATAALVNKIVVEYESNDPQITIITN